jgi:hypothetical protein
MHPSFVRQMLCGLPSAINAYLLDPGSHEAQVAAAVRQVEEAMRLVPRTAAAELHGIVDNR